VVSEGESVAASICFPALLVCVIPAPKWPKPSPCPTARVRMHVSCLSSFSNSYGRSAWWWEAEELVRKLLLTAAVVLLDEGVPLQITLAVLVSSWAHILHAMYKPCTLQVLGAGVSAVNAQASTCVFAFGAAVLLTPYCHCFAAVSVLSILLLCAFSGREPVLTVQHIGHAADMTGAPWSGQLIYSVQHASLLVTSFVCVPGSFAGFPMFPPMPSTPPPLHTHVEAPA
jgi:hypothetical protein